VVADYRLVVLPTIQRLFTWCCGRTDESEEACADSEDFHLEWAVNERTKLPVSRDSLLDREHFEANGTHQQHPRLCLVGLDCAAPLLATTPALATTTGAVRGVFLAACGG
jgi:hypothetical protein